MNYGLVIAAGKGAKFGENVDRAFLSLGPRPILAYSLLAFEACADIDGVVLVVRKDRVDAARGMAQIFGCSKIIKVVAGAALRQVSVQNGLDVMPDDVKMVTIHEASRPGVTSDLISETIAASKRGGAASVGLKIDDPVVSSERGAAVNESVDGSKLWTLQSPQSFKFDILQKSMKKFDGKKINNITLQMREIDGEKNETALDDFENTYLAPTNKKIDGYPSIWMVKGSDVTEFDQKPDFDQLSEMIHAVM
jgi:2-C-methyl-D-erythritol 4-phosphate cytidylyltransferase